MTTYAYLRISTNSQDHENQATGLREYAANRGITIDDEIIDTASGKTNWQLRELGPLIAKTNAGDTILVSEISRLARTTLQVLEIAAAASEKQIRIIATKSNLTLDDSISSKVTLTVLGLAAEIERDLIRSRTREALQQRVAKGFKLGRPKGRTSLSKIADRYQEIHNYRQKGISKSAISKIVGCSRGTLDRFLTRAAEKV